MLFYRLCLIALVVGMSNGKDSGGEEESDEEQNFSISIEDLDGVQIEVIPGNKNNSKWQKTPDIDIKLLFFKNIIYLAELSCELFNDPNWSSNIFTLKLVV